MVPGATGSSDQTKTPREAQTLVLSTRSLVDVV